jgi:hypothetical protein
MKITHILVLSSLAIAPLYPVHAEEQAKTEEPAKNPDDRSKVESWYVNLGLNYVRNGYGKDAKTVVDLFNSVSSNSTSLSLALGLDIGVYFPITNTIALGIIDNAIADAYSATGVSSSFSSVSRSLTIAQGFIGASAQYFLSGDYIGKGFYVRTDAGVSYFQVSAESTVGGATVKGSDSEVGYGFQGGVGYGIPTSPGARVLLDALYSYRATSHYSSGSLTAGVSILF